MDDFNWKLKVVQSCPLWITELGREEVVEWVQEQADCDLGLMQIEYTRCDALDRPFVSASIGTSLWEILIDPDGDGRWNFVKGNTSFMHIGLAKRWAAAQSELWAVGDANTYVGGENHYFDEEDFDEFDEDFD